MSSEYDCAACGRPGSDHEDTCNKVDALQQQLQARDATIAGLKKEIGHGVLVHNGQALLIEQQEATIARLEGERDRICARKFEEVFALRRELAEQQATIDAHEMALKYKSELIMEQRATITRLEAELNVHIILPSRPSTGARRNMNNDKQMEIDSLRQRMARLGGAIQEIVAIFESPDYDHADATSAVLKAKQALDGREKPAVE